MYSNCYRLIIISNKCIHYTKDGDIIIIHIVREGDSLYKIGQLYNVDYQKIANDNKIPPNEELIIGQTIVVITNDSNKKFKEMLVNGYAFPNISKDVLESTLPHLTYLSNFSYHVNLDGSLRLINDKDLINNAKMLNVKPIMVITNIGKNNSFDSDLVHIILNNGSIQNQLIINILSIIQEKNYDGLNIDFEYIYPEDKEAYIIFLNKINEELKKYNYSLSVSVAPKTSDTQTGLLYEAHDYQRIGKIADHVILMTYEWGYSGGPARAVAPIDLIQKVLDYAVTRIPSDKILMGIPNYGYDWKLPYMKGNLAISIGNYEAVDIARKNNQSISYSYKDQAPYFNYFDQDTTKHEVWFEDARSIQAKLELVVKYNLGGVSYWTINRPFPQNYLVLDYLYAIKKESN